MSLPMIRFMLKVTTILTESVNQNILNTVIEIIVGNI